MNVLWPFLLPMMGLGVGLLVEQSSKIKKLARQYQQLRKEKKGEEAVSQLIQNLVDQECQIYFEGLSNLYTWKVEAVDGEWLQISRQHKEKIIRELVRVDNIVKIAVSEQ